MDGNRPGPVVDGAVGGGRRRHRVEIVDRRERRRIASVDRGEGRQVAARRVVRRHRRIELPLLAVELRRARDRVDLGADGRLRLALLQRAAVVELRRRKRLVPAEAALARPTDGAGLLLHEERAVGLSARMRPDRQRHDALAVGEQWAGKKIRAARAVADPAHRGGVGDHQRIDERSCRILQPDGDLRAEVHSAHRLHAGRALVGPKAVGLERILKGHAGLGARHGGRQGDQHQQGK